MSNWHNEIHDELGWFKARQQAKIDAGITCGVCGEYTEYCCCGTLDKIQEASNDDFGIPVPAVMNVLIDKFAPKPERHHGRGCVTIRSMSGEEIVLCTNECKDVIIEEQVSQSSSNCNVCGSRTGQHGFSFDKKKW